MTLPQTLMCRVCGAASSTGIPVDAHHQVYRSAGGSDDASNLVRLCRRCHDAIHRGGWTLTQEDECLRVVDRNGEIIAEHWTPPDWFDASEFVNDLSKLPADLLRYPDHFRYLDYDQLREVAGILGQTDAYTWQAFAELLRVAKLQMPYGTKTEKFDTLLNDLGLKRSQGYKLVKALEILEDKPELFRFHPDGNGNLPNPDVVLLIAAQGDPEAAAALYQDRIADNPNYSRRQLQAELRNGVTDSLQAPAWCHAACSECGAHHPHIKPGIGDSKS